MIVPGYRMAGDGYRLLFGKARVKELRLLRVDAFRVGIGPGVKV
jgi:hypothetical protein